MIKDSGNIGEIAKSVKYKQIKVSRITWSDESYAIVEKLNFKNKSDKYPKAYGYCKFSNGSEKCGEIANAGTYSWVLVEILENNLELNKDVIR